MRTDRRFRFDGEKWVHTRRRNSFPVWSIAPTFCWVILLGFWLPLSMVNLPGGQPEPGHPRLGDRRRFDSHLGHARIGARVRCHAQGAVALAFDPPAEFCPDRRLFGVRREHSCLRRVGSRHIGGGGCTFFERPDIPCRADIHLGGRWIGASSGGAAQTDPVSAAFDGFVLSDR